MPRSKSGFWELIFVLPWSPNSTEWPSSSIFVPSFERVTLCTREVSLDGAAIAPEARKTVAIIVRRSWLRFFAVVLIWALLETMLCGGKAAVKLWRGEKNLLALGDANLLASALAHISP